MLAQREELEFASRWGWVVFRGILAILFGVLAFAEPATIGFALVLIFAVYAFVSGIAALVSAARGARAREPRWGTVLLEGLLYIVAGAVAVLWPGSTAVAFLWVLAFWAIFSGVLEIATAIRLRHHIEREWALGLAGGVSILFGLVMLFRPMIGALAVVWWLGAYAVVFGTLMIMAGVRMRRYAHSFGLDSHFPEEGLHQPT
jgi:uncharacterized membrane protein HdeD (DUF308 family)